jgi:hypothetical protein
VCRPHIQDSHLSPPWFTYNDQNSSVVFTHVQPSCVVPHATFSPPVYFASMFRPLACIFHTPCSDAQSHVKLSCVVCMSYSDLLCSTHPMFGSREWSTVFAMFRPHVLRVVHLPCPDLTHCPHAMFRAHLVHIPCSNIMYSPQTVFRSHI